MADKVLEVIDAEMRRAYLTLPGAQLFPAIDRLSAPRAEAADAMPPCACGHDYAAHRFHARPAGTPEPTYCSQGCGCPEYRKAGGGPAVIRGEAPP